MSPRANLRGKYCNKISKLEGKEKRIIENLEITTCYSVEKGNCIIRRGYFALLLCILPCLSLSEMSPL